MIQNVINIYPGIIQPIVLKTNKERLLPKSSYSVGFPWAWILHKIVIGPRPEPHSRDGSPR